MGAVKWPTPIAAYWLICPISKLLSKRQIEGMFTISIFCRSPTGMRFRPGSGKRGLAQASTIHNRFILLNLAMN